MRTFSEETFKESTRDFCRFVQKSPSPFHVIEAAKKILTDSGFQELDEGECWQLERGGAYFVSRNQSSMIAFRIPKKDYLGFQIVASHTDSPTFKVKENPEIRQGKHYTSLNVEGYGGMLCAPWFDRPLSLAGRAVLKVDNKIESRLLYFDRDLLSIVNLAIHMDRDANKGKTYKIQRDMLPLFSDGGEVSLKSLAARELGVDEALILSMDLYLVNRSQASLWGDKEQFFSSPKIDDLQCLYASLQGLTKTEPYLSICLAMFFDNEEVGSSTRQGALSDFADHCLRRIHKALGGDEEEYYQKLYNSFVLSADNGHALHPNYKEKTDPTNPAYINGGVLIKEAANQKYTSDAVTKAIIKDILNEEGIPWQIYVNHSDIAGGSTLGNLSAQKVSLPTVDIGVAQLAMHSPYETGGVFDSQWLIEAMKSFYQRTIRRQSDCIFEIIKEEDFETQRKHNFIEK